MLDRRSNALDIARDAFTLLVTGPKPLAVDGRDFAGLPDRVVPLNELRGRERDESISFVSRLGFEEISLRIPSTITAVETFHAPLATMAVKEASRFGAITMRP